MLQPSSSGVMHAYVKGRARDGTGTAAAARARLHTRNARTGMHATGGACRCLHELVALRRSAASTHPALVVDCGIFRKLPCLQTRYIVERAADASVGARIDPAQPLATVRGVCRKPASYSMNFDLLRWGSGYDRGMLWTKTKFRREYARTRYLKQNKGGEVVSPLGKAFRVSSPSDP